MTQTLFAESGQRMPRIGEKIAVREIYGRTLAELGRDNMDVVALDADLSASTKSAIFAKAFPERFFNAGVAEQNMIGMAAGLASCGKIPFASTFAVFATGRAFEQIRNSVAYPRLNVKIVASHAGIGVGEDGASHQAIEDMALMRALPHMSVLVPADAVEANQMVHAAAAWAGPVYMRMGRTPVPTIFDDGYTFVIGRAKSVYRPLEGAPQVTLIGVGSMVAECLQAARKLRECGVEASVLNCSSVKPLDNEAIVAAARESGAVVTAEEHSVVGGLGSAVAEVLSQYCPVPMAFVGLKDCFGQSGKPAELMEYYALTAEDIFQAASKLVAGRRTP
ncbi:MAG: transketolase family protein [Peptococcaceae bacterium]|nr:transketolase family protein [Peptococcaceae bacterium]